jgi:IPT/TIG domain-containing protein
MAVPVVSGVSPNTGLTTGGTFVVLTGTNFTGATGVSFGGTGATSFTVNSATQITAVAPAHAPGSVDVQVSNNDGLSSAAQGDQFLYVAAVPAITSVFPASGPTSGGTQVVLTGTNFTGATGVAFGGMAASFTVNSATQITATTPAGSAGTVDVRVTNASGTSVTGVGDQFLYQAPMPGLSSLSPSSGPTAGGTSVVITGTNFTGATAVTFGGTSASFTVNSATQITAIAPHHAAGTVDVLVATPNGISAAVQGDQFLYVAAVPTVTGVLPASGPAAGGTFVTVTGTNFGGATGVAFGDTAAGSFSVNSATQLQAVSPAHGAGKVDIRVGSPDGISAVSNADQFTYLAPVSQGGQEMAPTARDGVSEDEVVARRA